MLTAAGLTRGCPFARPSCGKAVNGELGGRQESEQERLLASVKAKRDY